MPLSFSDLTASFANHSIKHGPRNSKHPHPRPLSHQSRRSSSSSSSESGASSPSSPASIATATSSTNEHTSMMIMMPPPSMEQLDIVRDAWERVCERRLRNDIPSMSPAHAFGLAFYNELFNLDTSLKFKFSNVIQQARVLAGIMSYLTRSPSIRGEAVSLRDLNAIKKVSSSDRKPSFSSSSIHSHQANDNDDDHPLCAAHAAAAAAAAVDAANAYHDLVDRPPLARRPSVRPKVARGAYRAAAQDEVCPFNQQEQEEKFQQQLLLQQEQQEEQERQRAFMQQDLHNQMQKKIMARYQEENQWFAYRLREVGIQHVEEYDLAPEHLDVFGPAVITALKSRLQEEFTQDVERAWHKVCTFTFHHMRIGMDAHVAYHRRARRLSSGSYCSIEAGETNGACTIQ